MVFICRCLEEVPIKHTNFGNTLCIRAEMMSRCWYHYANTWFHQLQHLGFAQSYILCSCHHSNWGCTVTVPGARTTACQALVHRRKIQSDPRPSVCSFQNLSPWNTSNIPHLLLVTVKQRETLDPSRTVACPCMGWPSQVRVLNHSTFETWRLKQSHLYVL
jgi:hypothetical protein